MTAIRRWLDLSKGEAGMTLTEVLVAGATLAIVTGLFLTTVVTVQNQLGRQEERTRMNDQARLAVEQLDREIRSGNVLYDPQLEVPATDAGYALRIYTQSNATTRTPPFQCVQWRIESQQLRRRSWPPGRPEDTSSWRTVADDVVNRELDPAVPAFGLDPAAALGGRTIDVTLLLDNDIADTTTSTIRIETSLTGRNTGYPPDVCNPVPAG